MLWNSLGSIAGLGCQWLITILIVRIANGYEAAGVYSLSVSVYGIFAPIAQYRMYTYQVSDTNKENSTGEYIGFRILTSFGALLICMLYSFISCPAETWLAILLYGLYKTVSLVIDVLHGCDQIHHRLDLVGKSLMAQGALSLLAFVATFGLTDCLELALVSMTLAVAIVGFVYDRPRTSKFESTRPVFVKQKCLFLLRRCASIVVAGIAVSASTSIPRQYMSILFGSAALGAYSSVAAPVTIIQMGVSYIYNPLLSYFSEYYAKQDYRSFKKLLAKAAGAMVAVGAVCSIGVEVAGEPILVLMFGESITDHIYLMQPLVALAIITGGMWFSNDLLIALRNFKAAFIGSLISLIVSISSVAPLMAVFGLNGATFACILSAAASTTFGFYSLYKQLSKHA